MNHIKPSLGVVSASLISQRIEAAAHTFATECYIKPTEQDLLTIKVAMRMGAQIATQVEIERTRAEIASLSP